MILIPYMIKNKIRVLFVLKKIERISLSRFFLLKKKQNLQGPHLLICLLSQDPDSLEFMWELHGMEFLISNSQIFLWVFLPLLGAHTNFVWPQVNKIKSEPLIGTPSPGVHARALGDSNPLSQSALHYFSFQNPTARINKPEYRFVLQ